jgi:hypothetical protein
VESVKFISRDTTADLVRLSVLFGPRRTFRTDRHTNKQTNKQTKRSSEKTMKEQKTIGLPQQPGNQPLYETKPVFQQPVQSKGRRGILPWPPFGKTP